MPKGAGWSILVVGSGGIVAQAINALTLPILTRLYAPEAYATWALLISVVAIIGTVATLRYELAIVLPKEHARAANLLALAVGLSLLVSALTIPAFYFSGERVRALIGLSEFAPWIAWTPVLIAFTGLTQACQSWCVRMGRFRILSVSNILLALLTVGFQVSASWLGLHGAEGLVWGSIFGQCASGVLLLLALLIADGSTLRDSVTWRAMREEAGLYSNYPEFMTPYTLVGVLRDRLVLFFLNSFGPKAAVGLYAFSSRLTNLPVTLVSGAVRPVVFQRAAAFGTRSAESLIVGLQKLLAQLATPFWVLLFFVGPEFFSGVFGEQWRDASQYALILSTPALVLMLTNWLDRLLDVEGKQKLAFGMEAVFSTLSVGTFAVTLGVTRNVLFAASAQAAVLTVYYAYWTWKVFQVSKYDTGGIMRLAGLFLALAVGSFLVLAMLKAFLPESWAVALFCGGVLVISARAVSRVPSVLRS